MGTRADFYVGRGKQAEWLGSIALDGCPDGVPANPKYGPIIQAKTEQEFRERVGKMLAENNYATTPDQGWPWPWEDSRTSDYAYAFDGQVWASGFGYEWFDPTTPEPEYGEDAQKVAVFPNMKDRQNVTLGPRSGLIVGFISR